MKKSNKKNSIILIVAMITLFGLRYGVHKWIEHRNEEQYKTELAKLNKEPSWTAKKAYEKMKHQKSDDTKKWRNNKSSADSIKLAQKVNGTYSGGTTVQEVIDEFGNPNTTENSLDDHSVKIMTWTSGSNDPDSDCIKVTITNDADYSKAQVIKIDNRLLDVDNKNVGGMFYSIFNCDII